MNISTSAYLTGVCDALTNQCFSGSVLAYVYEDCCCSDGLLAFSCCYGLHLATALLMGGICQDNVDSTCLEQDHADAVQAAMILIHHDLLCEF